MGRITSEHQKETPTTVTHFSHPHPLTLINTDHHHHQQQQTLNLSPSSSCSGCSLRISGTIYSCAICKDFFLHKKCFDMPKKITHPFHKDHALTLLPVPAYEDGQFKCDACGEAGKCFSYHCKPCGVDLHVLCAAVPLTLTHSSHHMHKMDLTFESPYDTKDFSCDICKKPGGDHWLYRCGPCGFDAHLSCARGAPPPVSPRLHLQNVRTNLVGFQSQTPPPQQFTAFTRSAPAPPPPVQGFGPQFGGVPPPQIQGFGQQFEAAPPPPPRTAPPPPPQMQGFGPQFGGAPLPMQQNFVPPPPVMNNPAIGFPAGGSNHPHLVANRQHSEYLASYNSTLQQIMGQAAALGGGAGGVGGGYAGRVGGVGGDSVQQMMQMISAMNNGGGLGGGGGGISGVMNAFGGGGGGGGLIPGVMNAIGGGGVGGGQDLLQTLMNAGGGIGGGGLDTMTSLFDGIGGGGLDTMTSLLGGDGGGALDIIGGFLG